MAFVTCDWRWRQSCREGGGFINELQPGVTLTTASFSEHTEENSPQEKL